MRTHVLMTMAGVCLLWAGLARGEQAKDPAELISAKALAYMELRQPGPLLKEVASLFEGSALDNMPASLAKLRARQEYTGYSRSGEEWGVFSLFLAPEMIREAQRIQGAAVALTGIDKNHQPEFVVIILPGQSNLPGFVMRALLTMEPVHAVGEIEGVTLYRQVSYWAKANTGAPAEYHQTERGPAFAMMPGAMLIGTSDAVKDVIRRARGKGTGPTLASVPAYQETLKDLGSKPGLYSYANVPAVLETVRHAAPLGEREQQQWDVVQRVLNPKALGTVATCWSLEKGMLRYRLLARLQDGQKSPLLDVLPAQAFHTDLLSYAPTETWVAAGISNADGEKRLSTLLDLADAIAKANGQADNSPRRQLEQLETALGIQIGKDVVGKITDVAFVVGEPSDKGPGPRTPPMLLLVQATDEDAARTLTGEILPKIYRAALGQEEEVKPTEKKIEGQTISTLGSGQHAVYYGRHENTLVFSAESTGSAAAVAGALKAGAKKSGFLSEKKVNAAVQDLDGPVALVMSKPLPALMGLFFVGRSSRGVTTSDVSHISTSPSEEPPVTNPLPPPAAEPPQDIPPPPVKPRKKPRLPRFQSAPGARSDTLLADGDEPPPSDPPSTPPRKSEKTEGQGPEQKMEYFLKVAGEAEPFILSVNRKPDHILIEARQGGLKPVVAKLTDMALEEYFRDRPAKSGKATGHGPDQIAPSPFPGRPPGAGLQPPTGGTQAPVPPGPLPGPSEPPPPESRDRR